MGNQLTVVGRVGQVAMVVSFGGAGNKAVKFSIAATGFHDGTEELILWIDGVAWNGLGERVIKGGNKGREMVFAGGLANNKFIKGENGAKIRGTQISREACLLPVLRVQAVREV